MDENIKALLVKYITGDADENERLAARQWISGNQDNQDYFISLKAAWDDALHHPGQQVVNTNEAFDKLRKRLGTLRDIVPSVTAGGGPAETPLLPAVEEKPRRLFPALKAAAVAALILIVGGITYRAYKKDLTPPVPPSAFEIFVPNGKMKKIILPDSTEVWLNSGTRLSYAAGFGEHTREVTLDGEGYFAVRHLEKIPFIVKAHGYTVRDIGTVFTISAYPDNKSFQAAVIEGEVEVSGDLTQANKPGKILLTKNQILKIGQHSQAPHKAPVPSQKDTMDNIPSQPPVVQTQMSSAPEMERYSGWKDQLLVFNEETFDEVAQRLQRTFDVKIRITDVQLAGLRYTGRFNKVQNIEEAIRIIKETTPITYYLENDTMIISPDKKTL